MSLTVIKTSDSAHSWQISANTGRNQKTFKSRVKTNASGANDTAETTYIQAGKPEFISLVSHAIMSIGKNETSAQITLVSNSTKINASFISNVINASIDSITINGNAYTNNSVISGDPGGDAQYTVIINLTFKANSMASTRSFQLQVQDNGGHAVTVTGTQNADDPTIYVNPSTVQVTAAGGSGSITVASNDGWTVSVVTEAVQNEQNNQ